MYCGIINISLKFHFRTPCDILSFIKIRKSLNDFKYNLLFIKINEWMVYQFLTIFINNIGK